MSIFSSESLQKLAAQGPVSSAVRAINKYLVKLGPWQIEVEGKKFFPTTLDRLVVLALQKLKSSEYFELELWRTWIEPGQTVVDVGANLGLYSVIASERVGDKGEVFAFEPDPLNIVSLKKALVANHAKNVRLHEKAVGNINGTVLLGIRAEHHGDSQIGFADGSRESIPVVGITLDEALKDVGDVSLIKFDIQGAEAFAIQGMDRLLARNPKLRIMSEFWPEGLRRCGMEPREYLEFWIGHGFSVSRISEKERSLFKESVELLLTRAASARYLNLVFEKGFDS